MDGLLAIAGDEVAFKVHPAEVEFTVRISPLGARIVELNLARVHVAVPIVADVAVPKPYVIGVLPFQLSKGSVNRANRRRQVDDRMPGEHRFTTVKHP